MRRPSAADVGLASTSAEAGEEAFLSLPEEQGAPSVVQLLVGRGRGDLQQLLVVRARGRGGPSAACSKDLTSTTGV